MPRLFFAVRTPAPFLEPLKTLQNDLAENFSHRDPPPKLKFEKLENSHSTLNFLGNAPESIIEPLSAAVKTYLKRFPQFECNLGTCGVFPNTHHANVFWLGLKPEEPFRLLHQSITLTLSEIGWENEEKREFHPHLTIFRFRQPSQISKDFIFPDLSFIPPSNISEVLLIESKTLPSGPLHTIIERFPLSR